MFEILFKVSVRSGGHHYTCASLKDGSLHLDLRELNGLEFIDENSRPKEYNPEAGVRLLRLGPGNRWKDVLSKVKIDR